MASKARVRVELAFKNFPYHGDEYEKDQAKGYAFKSMWLAFKKKCSEYGVMSMYKDHQFFESKPRKDKKKRKKAEIRRLKELDIQKNGYKKKEDKNNKYKDNNNL